MERVILDDQNRSFRRTLEYLPIVHGLIGVTSFPRTPLTMEGELRFSGGEPAPVDYRRRAVDRNLVAIAPSHAECGKTQGVLVSRRLTEPPRLPVT